MRIVAGCMLVPLGALVSLLIPEVAGYGTGAPRKSCKDLLPEHWGATGILDPQPAPSPYRLTASNVGTVTVSIAGPPFRGFLIQAGTPDGVRIGSFVDLPSGTRLLKCKDGQLVTHSDMEYKDHVTITWSPPDDGFQGTVIFRATVAEEKRTFWAGHEAEIVIGGVSESEGGGQPHTCPAVMCAVYCSHGYKKDARGCDTCSCMPEGLQGGVAPGGEGGGGQAQPCPAVMCAAYCFNGYRKDAQGCDTCACNPEDLKEATHPCPVPMCSEECPYGYRHNELGCMTCRCNTHPPPASLIQPPGEYSSPKVDAAPSKEKSGRQERGLLDLCCDHEL